MIKYINSTEIQYGVVLQILKMINQQTDDEILWVKNLGMAKTEWNEENWVRDVFGQLGVAHLCQEGLIKVAPSSSVLATCAYQKLSESTLGCKKPSVLVQMIKKAEKFDQNLTM
ncbi:hypothetical protein O181_090715 [Austropuccinia psidii MF-1]|uniref:Uncharacterized protein n=1 Tax=Austropuccinia psidii MF-1 TaxID=1389203 RepID=A0A9Q3P7C7_9BASI|nr:hypothetical protein [Austropuccinia psidii MF-1]